MTDEVYSILAKVFSISESEISDTSSPESIESWDSSNFTGSGTLILADIILKKHENYAPVMYLLYVNMPKC